MKRASISPTRRIMLTILILSICSILIAVTINVFKPIPQWTGLGEDSNKSKTVERTVKDGKGIVTKITETEQFQSPKTLWDLLGLLGTLAIPLMLYLFQVSEQRRAEERTEVEKKQAEELAQHEKVIAENNLREQAFEAYIDRMAQILMNQRTRSELFKHEGTKDNSICDVARIRTVTILRRLEEDSKRRSRVIDFLHDAELLKFILKEANLSGINLEGINFSGIDLSRTVFCDANLSGANFSKADVSGANFTNANLTEADFEDARLVHTFFNGANLQRASLINTDIRDTKFINANLSDAILINASSWDEEEVDNNFDSVVEVGDNGELSWSHDNLIWYDTNFSGAVLTNANLESANLKGAGNLTVEQLKQAKNWDEAIYGEKLFKKLGLPQNLSYLINERFEDLRHRSSQYDKFVTGISYKDIDFQDFIGKPIEIRGKVSKETKTATKGEIIDFSADREEVDVKTADGKILNKISTSRVYIYMNTSSSGKE
jgi:uncharacterized protein YjbI with pentapeptide repeats